MSTVIMAVALIGAVSLSALLFAWALSEAGPPEWHLFRRTDGNR